MHSATPIGWTLGSAEHLWDFGSDSEQSAVHTCWTPYGTEYIEERMMSVRMSVLSEQSYGCDLYAQNHSYIQEHRIVLPETFT